MTLLNGQYELDGFVFGDGCPVKVADVNHGDRVVFDQDTKVPGGDGRLMGRDTEDGPEWVFDLLVRGAGGEAEVLETVEAARAAWEGPRSMPGAVSPLRYAIGGRIRRIYGRPRRFRPFVKGPTSEAGLARVLATFQLADPLIYDDTPQSLDLSLTPEGAAALTLPAELPWTLGALAGQRQGIVHVEGRAPTPFRLTFHGPTSGTATGLWAQGPGWRVDLPTAVVAWDQRIVVDTRAHTVRRSDGVSLAGAARGRFLAARLRPGAQEIAWGATDPTLTARAEIEWHPAYYSL